MMILAIDHYAKENFNPTGTLHFANVQESDTNKRYSCIAQNSVLRRGEFSEPQTIVSNGGNNSFTSILNYDVL